MHAKKLRRNLLDLRWACRKSLDCNHLDSLTGIFIGCFRSRCGKVVGWDSPHRRDHSGRERSQPEVPNSRGPAARFGSRGKFALGHRLTILHGTTDVEG